MSFIAGKWPRRNADHDRKSDRWGAIGAGWVLVVLPSFALFFGASYLEEHESIGLPVVAVFGIMVLVGALAMTSTLFRRLGLASRRQPLALPSGSVRATMALALIVLFAIIAIAAMRPPQELKELRGLSGTLLAELSRDPRINVIKSTPEDCASKPAAPAPGKASVIALKPVGTAPKAACPAADERYTVLVKLGPDAGSQDLVKQLVLTIGQLMTMAVSFYFAGRNASIANANKDAVADAADKTGAKPNGGADDHVAPADGTDKPKPAGDAAATDPQPGAVAVANRTVTGPGPRSGTTFDLGAGDAQRAAAHDQHDGCGVAGAHHTPDEDLPEAQGGIARP